MTSMKDIRSIFSLLCLLVAFPATVAQETALGTGTDAPLENFHHPIFTTLKGDFVAVCEPADMSELHGYTLTALNTLMALHDNDEIGGDVTFDSIEVDLESLSLHPKSPATSSIDVENRALREQKPRSLKMTMSMSMYFAAVMSGSCRSCPADDFLSDGFRKLRGGAMSWIELVELQLTRVLTKKIFQLQRSGNMACLEGVNTVTVALHEPYEEEGTSREGWW